ncbi:alpha/beta hydrolase [Enterococcus devriesei]|uniref:alpha/beta hydrolase n=1 Tax=Enterococcus devriesei TaxID=319970 RepID=UPI001C117A92|nr:alpha/beta hydrolase [Enterococcus devriesei]MBU5365414.1 alpha/beta hydrolase [Enterococcus devriesei]MDT2822509.1 alpha/beta hydrolase [Enterococcus devriesei]
MNKKTKIILGIILLLVIALIAAGNYFYSYAVVPTEKDFLSDSSEKKSAELVAAEDWFNDKNNRSEWQLQSKDGLKLSAYYLPAQKDQHKTAIIAHGYMGQASDMPQYAKIYHDLGYNVLMPDARGHGKSEGDYIGFGWPERKDYLQWIDRIVKDDSQSEIVLHGVSMGAATVMMTSGEKLPENVKAFVEDCGYSSAKDELSYQLKDMFNLPAFPLIPVTSLITKIRAGYFFGEANAVKQLHNNTKPMLFIHGDKDAFVPFSMLDTVYEATKGPKEKYVVHGAKHAEALSTDPAMYQEKVTEFLETYVK